MIRACCAGHVVGPNGDIEEVRARKVCGQEDESIEVELDEKIESGFRMVTKVQNPREPLKEERTQHEITHLPHRSWCRHCVRRRGKQMPHLQGAQETNMSVVHLDFAFLGREEDPQRTMKVRTFKMSMSAAFPLKTTGAYVAKRVAGPFARSRMSARRRVVKSDQGARSALDSQGCGSIEGGGRVRAMA